MDVKLINTFQHKYKQRVIKFPCKSNKALIILAILFIWSGNYSEMKAIGSSDSVNAYRFRSDFKTKLDHNSGWGADNSWSESIQISQHPVISNAVDSDQAGADVTVFEDKLYLVYISHDTQELYFTSIKNYEEVPPAEVIVSNIEASWVRCGILLEQPESPCFGIIYDAGSKGGSGFNRYICVPLPADKSLPELFSVCP
jgi:hypothetical protein